MKFNGTQWIYFAYDRPSDLDSLSYSEFTIQASFPMDIYLSASADSDPNEFQHDLGIKQTNYFKFSSQHFPTMTSFTAAVRVTGL